jgi:hypothetical protein
MPVLFGVIFFVIPGVARNLNQMYRIDRSGKTEGFGVKFYGSGGRKVLPAPRFLRKGAKIVFSKIRGNKSLIFEDPTNSLYRCVHTPPHSNATFTNSACCCSWRFLKPVAGDEAAGSDTNSNCFLL